MNHDLLDRNLAVLLRRAYRRELPSARFRERLKHACVATVPARQRRASWLDVRVAAAVLVLAAALGVAWVMLGRTAPRSQRDELLASELIAVREGDAEWRAARLDEIEGGLVYRGPSLDVATPTSRSVSVILPRTARLRIDLSSAVHVGDVGSQLEIVAVLGRAWLDDRCLAAGARVVIDRDAVPVAYDRAAVADSDRTAVVASDPSAPADPVAKTAAIEGQVRDAATSEPVRKFRLTLLQERELPRVPQPLVWQVDDVDGAFAVAVREAGDYQLFIEADGYATYKRGVLQIALDQPPVSVDALLESGGSVRGFVVDARTSRPLAGALVLSESDVPVRILPTSCDGIAEGIATAAVLTAADGSFELGHSSAGDHILRASCPGYAPSWSGLVNVRAGENLEGVLFKLRAGGGVRGHVVDAHGLPVANVVMVANLIETSRSRCMTYGLALTDAQGIYEIGDLAAGAYAIVHLGVNGARRDDPLVVPARVSAGAWTTLDFPVAPQGVRLFGVVRDARGNAITRGSVSVMREGASEPIVAWRGSSIQADGSYEILGLAPGRYHLSVGASMGPGQVVQEKIDIPTAEQCEHAVTVAEGELRGTVQRRDDREPVRSPVLILERHTGGAELEFAAQVFGDESGRFAARYVPVGTYRVTCFDTQQNLALEVRDDITLDERVKVHELAFALAAGGSATAVVTDTAGAPVVGAVVTVLDAMGRVIDLAATQVTNREGQFRAYGLTPGAWRITARKDSRSGAGEVTVVANASAHVKIQIR